MGDIEGVGAEDERADAGVDGEIKRAGCDRHDNGTPPFDSCHRGKAKQSNPRNLGVV
jgi:hypothetical protein